MHQQLLQISVVGSPALLEYFRGCFVLCCPASCPILAACKQLNPTPCWSNCWLPPGWIGQFTGVDPLLLVKPNSSLYPHRDSAESSLTFLGLLVMKNVLKRESEPVIRLLRNANIRPVMVTGDDAGGTGTLGLGVRLGTEQPQCARDEGFLHQKSVA